MIRTYIYKVAGFRFSVQVPAAVDMERMLPSFRNFREEEGGEELFSMEAFHGPMTEGETGEVWEESVNDMGFSRLERTENGYRITLRYTEQGTEHRMWTDRRFTFVKVAIDWTDPYAGQVLSSMLRMVYSQAVVYHRAVSIHASVVCLENKGFLFMGKSGTGKSTHAMLWQEAFPGCELLNDDNPTLCLEEEGVQVYGTPWSGKTPCYKNRSCLVQGMVRLRQAKENRFEQQTGIGAFIHLLPGCSVVRKDKEQYDALCTTLIEMIDKVKMGVLACLPTQEAARVCRAAL